MLNALRKFIEKKTARSEEKSKYVGRDVNSEDERDPIEIDMDRAWEIESQMKAQNDLCVKRKMAEDRFAHEQKKQSREKEAEKKQRDLKGEMDVGLKRQLEVSELMRRDSDCFLQAISSYMLIQESPVGKPANDELKQPTVSDFVSTKVRPRKKKGNVEMGPLTALRFECSTQKKEHRSHV